MNGLHFRLIVVLALLGFNSTGRTIRANSGDAREWERLSHPPLDSTQMRDTRIWFGLQHQGKCRVFVTVIDKSGVTVRHLAERMMSSGYYNLYWDKRDDSGRFVPSGQYFYQVSSSSSPELTRKLTVSYKPFERVVRIEVDSADKEAAALVVVDTSAVRLSLDVFRLDGIQADSLCPDTVLSPGRHRFVWKPGLNTALGEYWLRLKAESFLTEEKIRLR